MNIDNIIKEFISVKPEGYEKDIRIFLDYLKASQPPIVNEVVLQGIRTKHIVESIDFYIIKSELTSVSPVKRYVSAIAEFFKFAIGNGYIDNKALYDEILLPSVLKNSYWGTINSSISNNEMLKEKSMFDILEKDEVKKLINDCNDAINVFITEYKSYNKLLSAICIKLISLTGTVYRQIREIKYSEDIVNYNILTINGFKFYIPLSLSEQLKNYLGIRKRILEKTNVKSEYLFITKDARQLPKNTNIISDFLAICTGRRDLNGLIKYAIREMMMVGISDSVISKFTGAGSELINQCIDNIENLPSSVYWNRYLDSKIRLIETFDVL